ncbi:MAG: V-type ATP synthase subunit K [Candidatus Bipolaricaulia bacterium]
METIWGLTGLNWAYVGAAVAYGLAGSGSAIGIAFAGRVGAGVIAEDPGKFGSVLVLALLPGTQGIYGFVTGVLIFFTQATVTEGAEALKAIEGFQVFIASLPIAIAGLFSAIYQGKVCASGINLIAKRPEEFGRAMTIAVLVETYAVFGFLWSILLLFLMP